MQLAGASLLFLLAAASYAPTLRAGYIWDDGAYLTANPLITRDGEFWRIWLEPRASPQYYPLVFTTFWVQYRLVGLEPSSYHAVNVLLHASSAILVWMLLRGYGSSGSLLAAALFATHPVHVESVAWVAERKNVLSGTLYLLALLAFSRFAGLGTRGRERAREGRAWLWAAWLAFVAALFSKTVTSSLPAVVLLIAWWQRRVSWGLAVATLPFLAVGVTLGLHTAALERYHVGASGPQWDLSLLERVLIGGRVFWFYLGKLALPFNLNFVYPRWEVDAGRVWQYAPPLATVSAVALVWIARRRYGRGPFAAVLFYLVTLAPASGFFDVYPMQFSFVADHFVYLASLGPLALAAALLDTGARRVGVSQRWARQALAGALLLGLGILTWQRCLSFQSEERLWRDTLTRNPGAWMAANNLGGLLLREGRKEEAVPWLERAVRLNPGLIEARSNLGLALSFTGRRPEAIRVYEAALQVEPAYTPARYNLALSLAAEGDLSSARQHLEWVVRQEPRATLAWRDLGRVLAALGEPSQAHAALSRALSLAPDDALAKNELAAVEEALERSTAEGP